MFTKALLVGAFAAFAAAQSTVLTFTRVPNPVTDGQPQAITFATNDTASPVTITLRKGASGNLQTVTVLTSDATDGQYIWTPPMGLPNGNDYALQITQAREVNYFGPFTVQGASASASGYPSSSASISLTTSVSASANTTMTTTAVVPIGTGGTVGSMSAGTGTALPRNTTMSIATLTSSKTGKTTSTATATDSGAGFQGSQTSSGSSASQTGASSASINLGSSVALFGALAAALFMQ